MTVKDQSLPTLLGLVIAVHLLAVGCAPESEESGDSAAPTNATPAVGASESTAPTTPSSEPETATPPSVAPTPESAELAEVLAEMEQIQVRGIELSKELTRIETEARTDAEVTEMIEGLESLRETQDETVLGWIKADHPESADQVERFVEVGKQLEQMQFETPEEGADTPSIEEQQALRTSLVSEYQELEVALNPILQGVREQARFLELQGVFTNRVQQVQETLFSKMADIDPQVTEWREERDQLAEQFSALRDQVNTIQLRNMAPATNAAPATPAIEPESEAPQE